MPLLADYGSIIRIWGNGRSKTDIVKAIKEGHAFWMNVSIYAPMLRLPPKIPMSLAHSIRGIIHDWQSNDAIMHFFS